MPSHSKKLFTNLNEGQKLAIYLAVKWNVLGFALEATNLVSTDTLTHKTTHEH